MKTELTENRKFYIKRSLDVSPNQRSFDLHAHEHYELLLFLSGDITYLVEGKHYHPKRGDILIFNIAETHKVIVNSNMPYERIVIQVDKGLLHSFDTSGHLVRCLGERKPGEANIIHAESFEDDFWLRCVEHLPNSASGESTQILAVLFFLLYEIAKASENAVDLAEEISEAAEIVRYINEHIAEDITPASVAERFFISRTALYALFKEATGSSVHEYINLKRLLSAREMLSAGESPTAVYLKCGFKDYSTFYRSYKKKFGKSPAILSKQGR